ncbi:uncharacterized protein LOC112904215 [Agrilus planipennis]|uniref:Uncharacterized protein LOC112904215 n=1 Tax=Agrilus planipennis TaxID=224129 RepID=A0A7F5R2X2_AGRPL|nr:uncharacterized protein LOC112904215 [Agrilus planipennis]
MDIIGPMPPSRGYRYCLTMIDRFTRWPEATPIKDITADTVVDAFFQTWVARYGAPGKITHDIGTQFDSQLFDAMTTMIGCKTVRTTSYHPVGNGLVERWHRTLKAAIKAHETSNWVNVLPVVLLGLRTSYKDDIKASAAEMTYGTTLRLPGEYFMEDEPLPDPNFFLEHLRQSMRKLRPKPTAHHHKPKIFTHKALHDCTHVFVRVDRVKKPLKQPYEGPFEVIRKTNEFCFRVNVNGTPTEILIDRLKPAFIENEAATTPESDEHSSAGYRTYPGPRTRHVTFAPQPGRSRRSTVAIHRTESIVIVTRYTTVILISLLVLPRWNKIDIH